MTALGQISRCIDEERLQALGEGGDGSRARGPDPELGRSRSSMRRCVILVNGQQFVPTADFDPAELAQFVVQAAGDAFSDNPTPTPTPTPTADARALIDRHQSPLSGLNRRPSLYKSGALPLS